MASLRDSPFRFLVAGVGAVILVGAVSWSHRQPSRDDSVVPELSKADA